MPKVILDTDILSEIFKERNSMVLARALDYLQTHPVLSYTSVSVSELLFGLHAKDAKRQLEKAKAFLGSHEEIVPVSEDYWLVAEISAALYRAGRPIGSGDPLIAACALRRGYPIATGNIAHFEFIQQVGYELKLENWRDA